MFKRALPSLSAKEVAMQLLSRRDHGEYELSQKLIYKGFDENTVYEAIKFCLDHNYLDDLRYAKSQVRQHVYKGHGERRIRQELKQKRVTEAIIDLAMEEESQDWFELAKQVGEKNFMAKRLKIQSNMLSKFVFFNIEVLPLNR